MRSGRSMWVMASASLMLVGALTLTACATPATVGITPMPLAGGPPVAMAGPPEAMHDAVRPSGTPKVIASGLSAPWSIVRLTSGSTLISERDHARVMELTGDGTLRLVGQVEDVQPAGEGGLLGLAVRAGETSWLYAYYTGAEDNRVVRMPLLGASGNYRRIASELWPFVDAGPATDLGRAEAAWLAERPG